MLAILAFSLTAGFSAENQYTCIFNGTNETATFTLKSSYPYSEYELSVSEAGDTQSRDLEGHYSSGAEFFVAWGVLSMIYCLVAIPMYMLLTANEDLGTINNILIIFVSLCSVLCEVDISVCNFIYRILASLFFGLSCGSLHLLRGLLNQTSSRMTWRT